MLVACAIALALPAGQLRFVMVDRACCCPDVDHCKCPHDQDSSPDAKIKACHATQEVFVAGGLAAFATPPRVAAIDPIRVTVRTDFVTIEPHAAPPPRRPDAPS